jgi:hypothetical protein
MIVLCSYPLVEWGAAEILALARTHRFAIAKRAGNWGSCGVEKSANIAGSLRHADDA